MLSFCFLLPLSKISILSLWFFWNEKILKPTVSFIFLLKVCVNTTVRTSCIALSRVVMCRKNLPVGIVLCRASVVRLKKEFIGPGLLLRPVCADHAQPLLQWTLNSVLSACGDDNWKDKTPSGLGNLEGRTQVTHRLRENRHSSPLPPDSIYHVTTGLSVINWLECNHGLIDY